MNRYQGTPVSPGIATGPAWIYQTREISITSVVGENPETEWQRLENAFTRAGQELATLAEQTKTAIGEQEAAIFNAHQLFLEDAELLKALKNAIYQEGKNAEAAVAEGFARYADLLLALDDEYFKARAQDVRDVEQRVLRILQGYEDTTRQRLNKPSIILADDLTPSDTIQFDRTKILGLCTVRGGPTSHTAILARALGVPAIVNAAIPLQEIANDDVIILNGDTGEILVRPSEEALLAARRRQQQSLTEQAQRLALVEQPATTRDGHTVEIVANVGNAADAKQALEMGAEGIGLLRTEFLYLNRASIPSETEQVESYCRIFEIMGNRPVVVRTLDIGGDKAVTYLGLRREANPFLGWRAIRMMDERPDILETQFRALLIAAAQCQTDLRIMLPLVSRIEEVEAARSLFEQVTRQLHKAELHLPHPVQFGVMVEVPAVALLAEHFAKLVDFFSIGTNDLTQYALAVDRTNERVSQLASPYHPAALKLIAQTIEAAHNQGIWVGLCGELAGDPLAAPLLLGLGLDEFSMAPVSIPLVKERVRELDLPACRILAEKALQSRTADEVRRHLEQFGSRE